MLTDVLAAKTITAAGQVTDFSDRVIPRLRIKYIYAVCGATAGNVTVRDGTSGTDEIILQMPTSATADDGTVHLAIPAEGILAKNGAYVDPGEATSVVIIYG